MKKNIPFLLNLIIILFVFNINAFSQVYKYKQVKIGGRKMKISGNIFISDSMIVDNPNLKTSQAYTTNYPVKVIEDNEQMKTYKVMRPTDDNTKQDCIIYFNKQKGILRIETRNNFTNSVFDYEYEFQ